MFGLIGLFGALFMGFMAEGVMSKDIDVSDDDDSADDDSQPLTLSGDAGNNLLEGGSGGDLLNGGEGTAATITDFNADEDTLVVHYFEDEDIPEVSVETEDGNSMVLLDGVVIATLLGNTSFDVSQISLIGT